MIIRQARMSKPSIISGMYTRIFYRHDGQKELLELIQVGVEVTTL
jgi:hypothetical protein